MIEVEKKFRPTEEQLKRLLDDSVFIKEVVNHDIIYDYPDYRLIKKGIRLRSRNGNLELKASTESEDDGDKMDSSFSLELENEEEIKKYLNINIPVAEFIKNNLIEGINIKTTRKKYKKDNFVIDIDNIDFGYQCVEIELMVENKSEVSSAYEKIINLAKTYGFDIQDVPTKKREYFRIVKPDVFRQLYPSG